MLTQCPWQEEEKLVNDGQEMAQRADDALAELDEGLSQFRAKMKAKKEQSEASLREQEEEFKNLSAPVQASDTATANTSHATASDATSASVMVETPTNPGPQTGASRFKMSLYKKMRPKGGHLEEIK